MYSGCVQNCFDVLDVLYERQTSGLAVYSLDWTF